MDKYIIIFFSIINIPLFAGGKFVEAQNIIDSFIHLQNEGLVGAVLVKEGCSCMFVSQLANHFISNLESPSPSELKKASKECEKRGSIPFVNLLQLGFELSIERTSRKKTHLKYSDYKFVAEQWRVNRPLLGHHRVLRKRFEAVLDDNPKYGCRMRITHDGTKYQIKSVIPKGRNKYKVHFTNGNSEIIQTKSARGNKVILQEGKINTQKNWPESLSNSKIWL